jgi:hypothetical protein
MTQQKDNMMKANGTKTKRQRSPNYPAVGLQNAVERARKLYDADGPPGSTLAAAFERIGFSNAHGQAQAVMSALKKFGLLEYVDGRMVPTKLAIDVFEFPENHPRHIAALQEMALKPIIYAELVEQFREHARLPSDDSLRPELVSDKGFNKLAVDGFLSDFRSSLEYAGLLEGNTLKLSIQGDSGHNDAPEQPEQDRDNPAATLFGKIMDGGMFGRFVAKPKVPIGTQSALPLSEKKMRDLAIPLMDDEVAYLRIPVPLSEENYEYLVAQIAMFKRGIVARPTPIPITGGAKPPEGNVVPNDPNVAQVPFMITKHMRQRLHGLGIDDEKIATLTPAAAWDILNKAEFG